MPNRISLSGHTDTTPYVSAGGYTNWDLSADRANAARRALEGGGLAPTRSSRVVGLSSSVLFDKENPRNPINRRISIIVMTKEAEESALKTDAMPESAGAAPASVTSPVTDTLAATDAPNAAATAASPAGADAPPAAAK